MPISTIYNEPTTRERNGFTEFQTLGNSLIKDLIERGFEAVYPIPNSVNANTFVATLKPRTPPAPTDFTPNSLAGTQDWHIHIDCSFAITDSDPGAIKIYVAHPLQLPDTGFVSEEYRNLDNNNFIRKSGELTSGWFTPTKQIYSYITTDVGSDTIPFASRFWNNLDAAIVDTGSKTYSYRLTVSYQGIALVIWEENQDIEGNRFSWFVIQRPVNPVNGAVLQSGKCPVFCIYSIGGGQPNDAELMNPRLEETDEPYQRTHPQYDYNPAIYRFVVREVDVYRPTIPVLATVDSPDNRIVISAKQQVAITEGNKYVITFPTGFNTDRYMYKEEIDLITYTSADVISQYSNVAVSVYGEDDSRQYKAMQANMTNNTGMRILILVMGPGFSPV